MTRPDLDTEAGCRTGTDTTYDVETTVRDRYARGAVTMEQGLCCPDPGYDPSLLAVLPDEILEKDYGCGDPSKYIGLGETVVDLGSGAGKICYIMAQKVGREGMVIGVDFNDAMLAVARRYQHALAESFGYGNVRFVKGRIQDLALDMDLAGDWLAAHPVDSVETLAAFESECDRLRRDTPMIGSDTVDAVVSNCVLNLVRPEDKRLLFAEIYRVLRRGGRAVISDIVCDEDPTPSIIGDPALWSGCIAGAFREDVFLTMFEEAGFHGIEILSRAEAPWQTIDGVEFRSMTVRAFKGKEGPCLERHQGVIYRGPWKTVTDDDGHVLHRGQRMAVCDKTLHLYTDVVGPYAGQVEPINPRDPVPLDAAVAFGCQRSAYRSPRQTKGADYRDSIEPAADVCCGPEDCC